MNLRGGGKSYKGGRVWGYMPERYLIEPESEEKSYLPEDVYWLVSRYGLIDLNGLREKIKDFAWVEIIFDDAKGGTFTFKFSNERTPKATRILINKKGSPSVWLPTQLKSFDLDKRFSGNWIKNNIFQSYNVIGELQP